MYNVRGGILTDDDCQDDENNDDENDPQLHILPPQLALQTSRRTLEHVSILVQIVCRVHMSMMKGRT